MAKRGLVDRAKNNRNRRVFSITKRASDGYFENNGERHSDLKMALKIHFEAIFRLDQSSWLWHVIARIVYPNQVDGLLSELKKYTKFLVINTLRHTTDV